MAHGTSWLSRCVRDPHPSGLWTLLLQPLGKRSLQTAQVKGHRSSSLVWLPVHPADPAPTEHVPSEQAFTTSYVADTSALL